MPAEPIDPARVEAELAADADVIRSLRENGDDPRVVRPVDVHFLGGREPILRLADAAESLGWSVAQVMDCDDGGLAIDLCRDQTTDEAAVRQLTFDALVIEQTYGLSYDGWGTMAHPS